jgi:hypothetical protein
MKVYVDAKILNRHDVALEHEAFVGYIVEGSGKKDAKQVEAEESDDAEVLAVLFAIEGLNDGTQELTVVCDHESVVSEATRDEVKKPSKCMSELRELIKKNPNVHLQALLANPAHKVVTDYVNETKNARV